MIKTQQQLNFISDAGHGWLQVKTADIKALGVEISPYSYYNAYTGDAYLEEDCDAPKMLAALESNGVTVTITTIELAGDCFIRRLKRIRGN